MAINNFNVGVGTTSQLTRYRYVATGGETSVSGTDADGKTLSYTVGLEQVFLNGVNLVRGQDYTATNGTSVGSLTALVASDVVEVFAFVPFNIANALTVSTVDAKGDLLVGTGADAVGRLVAGTDSKYLVANSAETSGLKWTSPGNFELINTGGTSLTGATTITVSGISNKNFLHIVITSASAGASAGYTLRFNGDSGSNYNYTNMGWYSGAVDSNARRGYSYVYLGSQGTSAANEFAAEVTVLGANTAGFKPLFYGTSGTGTNSSFYAGSGGYYGTSAISSVSIISGVGNFDAGTIYVYGAI
jgi:hypothetical protein